MEIAGETERKYDVPAEFQLPDLAGKAGISSVHGGETQDLDATYFDTDELTLMRNRRTLRRRTGGGDAGWHLKTPGDGTSRTEHRVPLNGDAGKSDAGKSQVPAELVGQVRAIIRRRALKPIARLRTHRVETPLRDAKGNTLALVAQDHVVAETDGREQRWQEVEVELVHGGDKLLDAVERVLLHAGATPAEGPSKVARALGNKPVPVAKGKTKNPVLLYVQEQRDAITGYDPGVRRGDPESVHKMRVGTRRLRSTLKTFKRSFPDAADLGDELKWLADLLGQVRDGQVQEGKLLAGLEEAGEQFVPVAARIRDHLDAQVAAGRAALDEALESERYLTLLDRIDQLAAQRTAEKDPGARAVKGLAKADGLLDEALAHGEDHELHDARKAYKRARYAVEVFAPEGGKPAKQLVNALTDLQDVLGAHQDSVVARELLHELGQDSFWFGVLWARQEQVGKDTYAELPVVVETSRKQSLRRWLG